jgi:Sec-independent protein translocase protein TatA
MIPIGVQECQILLVIALLLVGAFKLPELAQGLAQAMSELGRDLGLREDELARLRRQAAVLACLLALTALATLAMDMDAVGRDMGRSLSLLTGGWR